MAVVDAKIISNDGVLCASAQVKFFLFPLDKAMKEFDYPGGEAFFEEEMN
jgi:hypothetical protein